MMGFTLCQQHPHSNLLCFLPPSRAEDDFRASGEESGSDGEDELVGLEAESRGGRARAAREREGRGAAATAAAGKPPSAPAGSSCAVANSAASGGAASGGGTSTQAAANDSREGVLGGWGWKVMLVYAAFDAAQLHR